MFVGSFPGGTNETLLRKYHAQHQNSPYYEVPQMKENAFFVIHYAGKIKYNIAVRPIICLFFIHF